MTRKPAADAAPLAARSRAPGFVGRLFQPLRPDGRALLGAGRESLAGIRVVLARRRATLSDTLGELRAVGRLVRHVGARQGLAHLDALALGAIQLTLSHMRELAVLAAATQADALQVLARRLHDEPNALRQLRSGRHASRGD
jgi:hypothetical protein